MRARGATPSLPSPRASSQRRRAPATTAMRTSLTVPPTTLRTRCTSSRSMTTPAVRRVPEGSEVSAEDERTSRVERATDAPMSRARPMSDSAPRTRSGSLRTSGTRPRAGSAGRGRRSGRSIGSRIAAARVSARSPSARAWWNLNRTAKETPSSPGSTCASHGGLPRSSGRSMSRPASAWKSAVGACSRTWWSGSKSGSASRVALPKDRDSGCHTSRMRIRSPGTAAARAARRSAAWAPAVGECAEKTPSAPRCIGFRSDSMFQNARSRGASRSEVNCLPRVD